MGFCRMTGKGPPARRNGTGLRQRVRMPHDVHAGKYVDQLPPDYLRFLVRGWDGERFPELVAECRRVLAGKGTPPAPTQAEPNAYAEFMAGVMRQGNWIPVPVSWCRALGLRASMILAALLNRGKIAADDDGRVATGPVLRRLAVADSFGQQALDRLVAARILSLEDGHAVVDLDRLREVVEEEQ